MLFRSGDAASWGLAIFLVAIGLGTAFMLVKLGETFGRLSSFIRGAERDVLPVVVKTGATARADAPMAAANNSTRNAWPRLTAAERIIRRGVRGQPCRP